MVKIRLARVGATNQPKYRIVVAHEQNARNGGVIEIIGNWDATKKPVKFELNKERYDYWLSVGAQPTEAIQKLLVNV